MSKVSIFCITLNPENEKFIMDLTYKPVGLGENKFSENFFSDKSGKNIAYLNPYYGEYTFHYWLWKNYLEKINTDWVGFCQYRKFFIKKDFSQKEITFEVLKNLVIKDIDTKINKFDCILGEKQSVENYKLSKIVKNHFLEFITNPSKIFFKKKRNIKFHFDLFHGKGNLDAAINLLDTKERKDFKAYVNNNSHFNPHNMFLCKKKFLKDYYDSVLPWLSDCEKLFDLNDLKGFGKKRIFGFLAERYLSFWFNKYCQVYELPILHKDLSDYK